jgi:hypothetical protein
MRAHDRDIERTHCKRFQGLRAERNDMECTHMSSSKEEFTVMNSKGSALIKIPRERSHA